MNNSKSFLFLVPLTPSRLMTPLRSLLFEQFLKGLQSQRYENWSAILIGEHEGTEGKVKYCRIMAESKEIKLIFAREYIRGLTVKPDYIIRIDDDDIINPYILEKVSKIEFDCYADRFHTFYDIISGEISLQSRPFLANTVIHHYDHAIAEIGEDKTPLIQSDHSFWINYYQSKRCVYAGKYFPVYLRVLSPTTITNGIFNKTGSTHSLYSSFKEKVVKLVEAPNIDLSAYAGYLGSHGRFTWLNRKRLPFHSALENLDRQWEVFSGIKRKKNLFSFLKFK
jgi:hypothetical protein